MFGSAMNTNIVDHLQSKWNACYQENELLRAELERVQQEFAEMKRRQKIALDNAYASGYEAGHEDARRKAR